MVQYTFREDGPLPIQNAKDANAQKIGKALEAISAEHLGHLRPGDVVEAARNPKSALHSHFTWDDKVAAEAYRMEEARALIRLVRVVDSELDEPPRAFLSVPDSDGISYRGYKEVQQSVELSLAVLRAAERDLTAFRRRYRSLQDVCALVEVAEEEVRRRMAPTESPTA